MKRILLSFLVICTNTHANEINVQDMSDIELFGEISSYLSDVKTNKNNEEKTKKYRDSFEELDLRAKSGKPIARMYRGVMDYSICKQAFGLGLDTKSNPICISAYKSFKYTSETPMVIFEHNRAFSYSYLGEMYKDGLGVEKSKLMAANSFTSSAVIYAKIDDKNNAFLNIEKALEVYPDHPKAKQLLGVMLNK
ncbi:hypothetical protein [Acinetobacter soli]|uniref:hypothetical protein n=1 Tax=Acinetobacter soli TaxID=487316 RepID=UPI00124F9528|nr:hypothetical protein [Acinetobacter soli]